MRASNGLYYQIYRELIKGLILEFVCCYLVLACSIVYFQNFMILLPIIVFLVSLLIKSSKYSSILSYVTGRILLNTYCSYGLTDRDYKDIVKLGRISSIISKSVRDKELIERIATKARY